MKTIIFFIALSSCLFAEELPQDYQVLKDTRAKQMEKLNSQYVKALKKLKTKYTKKGNLEMAVMIDNEIKSFKESPQKGEKIVSKPSSKTKNEEPSQGFQYNGTKWMMHRSLDGGKTFQKVGKPWTISKDQVMGVYLGKPRSFKMAGKYNFVVSGWAKGKFSEDYKSFEVSWGNGKIYRGLAPEK